MCDGSETEHTYVDNPEVAARARLRSQSADAVRGIRDLFDGVERAMAAGAWTGRPATNWENDLSGRASRAGQAAENFEQDLDSHVATLPARVPQCEVGTLGLGAFPFGGDPWDR